MNDQIPKVAGIPWYRLEDYETAMTIMEDRKNLHRTYTEWRLAAEQAEKHMRRNGWATIRAYIDPGNFAAWCRSNGVNVDSKGRNHYANSIAVESARKLIGHN